MITKTFKKLLNIIITANGTTQRKAYVSAKTTANNIRYLSGVMTSFPYSVTSTITLNNVSAGIIFGTGNTAATEYDYRIESPITSGINGSVQVNFGADENDNPYKIFNITINNTTTNDITINEIGFQQSINCATTKGGNASAGDVFLLERTVLDEPITISANSSKAIVYKMQANISEL